MKNIRLKKFKTSVFGIMFGISLGFGYEEFYGIGTWHSFETPTQSMNVCFTPPSGCGSLIAREIVTAQKSIYVQAYSLTSYAIINQLIAASERGVKVRAILDNTNFSESKSVVAELQNAGVEITRDKASGIAHNKVMIIDSKKVITGSFNFTEAADKRNAENVLLIQDKRIALEYLSNWMKRWAASK